MTIIKITISDEIQKEIRDTYENDDSKTLRIVVEDILDRYLNIDHFDPELDVNNK